MTRHRVLGVAGHIDHGKTALVKALTGTETDRLPEEKKRGITIELGFARWDGLDDMEVSVIDMPGHERFVRTMVAGAAGIDAVLLVVAADDGVMPQTREHLAVCELLGVERGVIALSKIDLVDEELIELVQEDIAMSVAGTFLEGAPIVPVSALQERGLDALRAAAAEVLAASDDRSSTGAAVLPVDRVFTKAGFGTVVTGTLLTGSLRVGDALEALPGERALKIRGLQVHGDAVELVESGRRVAVNVRGDEVHSLARGDLLATPGRVASTADLLVRVTLLDDAALIEERDEVSVHLGTHERLAKAIPLGAAVLEPGATGALRLVLDEPMAAYAGEAVVLRKPGAHGQATLGGGRVLDPLPRATKGAHKRWATTSARLMAGDAAERILALVDDARERGITREELARRSTLDTDQAAALRALEAKGAVALPDETHVIGAAVQERVEADLLELTGAHHAAHPLLFAVAPKELETQLPEVARGLASAVIERLVARGALERAEGGVRVPGHDPTAGDAGEKLRAVERVYRSAGLKPPLDDEGREAAKLSAQDFKEAAFALGRAGRLRRLGDLYFDSSALMDLKTRVREFFDGGQGELSTADFKDLAGGVSRKYAIPLLEHLDKDGVTQRKGDHRVRGRG